MAASVLNVEQTPPILSTDIAARILADQDITVSTSTTTDEEKLTELVTGHDGLMVHAGVPVTRQVIEAGSDLDIIARCGIGVDNVDLEAAGERGITVVNHPTYSVQEVATHALSLLLAGFRRVPEFDRKTRGGSWSWGDGAPIDRLSESTLGIVGFGSIGRRLAVLASGFGCDILAYDPYVDDAVMGRHNVESVELLSLCNRSNLVSVNAELTPETTGMIGADELAAIDDRGVLVNTARGPIVDTDALIAELAADGLGFVALDVTDPEPLPPDHPLFEFENFVATPHAGWYSERSRENLSRGIAEEITRVLNGDPPVNPIIE